MVSLKENSFTLTTWLSFFVGVRENHEITPHRRKRVSDSYWLKTHPLPSDSLCQRRGVSVLATLADTLTTWLLKFWVQLFQNLTDTHFYGYLSIHSAGTKVLFPLGVGHEDHNRHLATTKQIALVSLNFISCPSICLFGLAVAFSVRAR